MNSEMEGISIESQDMMQIEADVSQDDSEDMILNDTNHCVLVTDDRGNTTEIPLSTLLLAANIESSQEAGSDESVNQSWVPSKEEVSNQPWMRHGMWGHQEVELLQENINHYCLSHGISDPGVVIFGMNKEERKDFYRVVAKGINRPLFSIYRRVIRMYDERNHIGRYNMEELIQLRALRLKHGNDWQKIGCAMGRSPASIRDRCRLLKDHCNTGKWSPEEEDRLINALKDDDNNSTSWAAVATKVATRSEKQCRTKWLNYMAWKVAGGEEWSNTDDLLLVNRLMECDSLTENEVDWNSLCEGWSAARSPQWLRAKWWAIKRHIPNHDQMDFKEIQQGSMIYLTSVVEKKLSRADIPTMMQDVEVQTGFADTLVHGINSSMGTLAVALMPSIPTPIQVIQDSSLLDPDSVIVTTTSTPIMLSSTPILIQRAPFLSDSQPITAYFTPISGNLMVQADTLLTDVTVEEDGGPVINDQMLPHNGSPTPLDEDAKDSI